MNFKIPRCYYRMRKLNWFNIQCWIAKQLSFFDKHPWDWVAHLILGLLVFMVEWAVLTIFIDSVAIVLAAWGTVNALLFVELTQIDVFGLTFIRFLDTIIDLIFGGFGLVLGMTLLGLF